jgi:hypothetical protein
MDLNYNILELVFNYLDKNDKLKSINSNIFNKDLCFDQLMILYKYMDKKNKMLKTIRRDCTQIHNDDPISNSKFLYLENRVCEICNTWTSQTKTNNCDLYHTICWDCNRFSCCSDWFDICIECKQIIHKYEYECIICIMSKCSVCVNELIELSIKID